MIQYKDNNNIILHLNITFFSLFIIYFIQNVYYLSLYTYNFISIKIKTIIRFIQT